MRCVRFSVVVAIVFGLTLATQAATADLVSAPEPIAPIAAPFAMPQLSRPTFPARVVDIRDHGAVADGTTNNTAAFAHAITACAEAGGGRVLVPAGRWFTGPIHLRSHIELHLAEGAEVVFSDRYEDYLPVVLVRVGGVELYNYSPLIYARDCENVAITGPGRLNGNARAWWDWKKKETTSIFRLAPNGVPVDQRIFGTPEAGIRPNFVVFFNCRNVLLEGFTIGSGPNWTLHPVYCENVIIRRVHVLTDGPNNDGIDPDSCRNVLIEHCVFDTGDDCVVLKSGYNEDGWRVARPTENVVMRWCTGHRGHGGLVIGSEMSGDVRNVYVHDCEFVGTDRAVRIKSRRGRGGVVENVWAENLRGRDLKYEAVIVNLDYSADQSKAASEKPPLIRGLHFKNITSEGSPVAIRLTGLADAPIEDVTFKDLSIQSKRGILATHARQLRFTDVAIHPSEGPAYTFEHARDIAIRGASDTVAAGAPFVSIAGADSAGIRVETLAAATPPLIHRADDVPAEAVAITARSAEAR